MKRSTKETNYTIGKTFITLSGKLLPTNQEEMKQNNYCKSYMGKGCVCVRSQYPVYQMAELGCSDH